MKLWLVLVLVISAATAEIIIGGLFDEDSKKNDEKAFKVAIDLINEQRKPDQQKLVSSVEKIKLYNPLDAISKTCLLLEKGVVAIIGPQSQENFDAVQSVCDVKEIPIIQVFGNYKSLRYFSAINYFPHLSVLTEVFVDVLKKLDWQEYAVLYDDDDSLAKILNVIKFSENSTTRLVIARRLSDDDSISYRAVMKEISNSDISHIIINCKLENLEEILKQAQQVGIINKNYHFFITNLDLHTIDMDPFKYSHTNLTGLQLVELSKGSTNSKIIEEFCITNAETNNIDCTLSSSAALIVDAMLMLQSALERLESISTFAAKSLKCNSTESWEHGSSLVNLIKTARHKGITGDIKFDNKGYRSDFELKVISLDEDNGIKEIGVWNPQDRLVINKNSETEASNVEVEDTLVNKTLIVITCLTYPYAFLTDSEQLLTGNNRYEGFAIDLIDKMAALEKFKYIITIRDDKSNGAYNPKTKQWSGMIGDLINKTADLAIADLTINGERAGAVDFTSPFMHLGITILFRKPGPAPPNFFSFAQPFALDTWIGLALAFIIVSFSLYIMGRVSSDEWTNPYPCIEEPEFLVNQFSWQNAFWFSTGSLMQQGTEIAPISISTRMVAGMWWFFVLLMVASYTANLAAFLASENTIKLFEDVNDLVEKADELGIRYGAKSNGATAKFFQDSNETLYQKAWQYMLEHEGVMVNENADGVALAESEQYAFFMESSSIEYETERHCDLEKYGEPLDHKTYGIAMRKNYTYRNILSTSMLKLQSQGVIDELKRKWWKERRGGGQCSGGGDSQEAIPLNMKNVEGVFYLTIYGLVGGLFCGLLEKIVDIWKQSKRTKQSLIKTIKSEAKFYVDFDVNVKPVDNNPENEEEDAVHENAQNNVSLLKPPPIGFMNSVIHKK